jgi:hypothetical protein
MMPSSSGRGSQEYFLLPRPSDDSEIGDFGSPPTQSDDESVPIKSPHQCPPGLMEPMTIDESPGKSHRRLLWSRLWSSIQSHACPKRNDARPALCLDRRRWWFSRALGRRHRISRFIVYLIIAYLSFLCVHPIIEAIWPQ